MMQLERQKKILDYLNKNRKATTKELSQLLDVSTTTIRTDLNQMDKENLITKTHGGAVYNDRSLDNIELTGRAYFFDERALENQKEKEAIANKAIKLIKNHMCIYLDASSTCRTSTSATRCRRISPRRSESRRCASTLPARMSGTGPNVRDSIPATLIRERRARPLIRL